MSRKGKLLGATGAVALLTSLAACAVGPDYERPDAAIPAHYKEAEAAAQPGWKPAKPADEAGAGAWWSVYADPQLDLLERRIDVSNQTLKSAEAAFREARAIVGEARAGLFPTIDLGASAQRSKSGGGRGGATILNGTSFGGAAVSTSSNSSARDFFDTSASASWTLDVWGRIRRTLESDLANAQASAGDLAAARLSAQTALASDYFQLRITDELKRLFDQAVEAYQRSLQITQNQYKVGTAAKSDVITAQTQLQTTQAQAIALGVQRAQFEHAIAVLVGAPPAEFTLAPLDGPLPTQLPEIPGGLPSDLLQRRPDIAAAERRMAAANASIGVAIAAYYPDLTLSGSYGFASSHLPGLVQASNSLWSLGSQLAETLFDGGLRASQVAGARASYDAAVANYRQTVLSGFEQVENELAALRILRDQAAAQDIAVASAQEAERLLLNQYRAGTVAYTAVVTAQTTALSDEEAALSIRQSRLLASVSLITALGGGWDAAQLPSNAQLRSEAPGPLVP